MCIRLSAAALAVVLLASPALAQQCPPYEDVREALENDFGEHRQAMGLSGANPAAPWVMELWASDRGTWTIVLRMPDGTACMADGGDAFQMRP